MGITTTTTITETTNKREFKYNCLTTCLEMAAIFHVSSGWDAGVNSQMEMEMLDVAARTENMLLSAVSQRAVQLLDLLLL